MNLKDSNINDKENDTGVGMRQNNLCESTEDKEDRKRVKSRTRAPLSTTLSYAIVVAVHEIIRTRDEKTRKVLFWRWRNLFYGRKC